MKEQRVYIRFLTLLLIGLFILLACYGGYAVNTYGNRWFASNSNPRIRSERKNIITGDILDRNGVMLATTSDGSRVYQSDGSVRRAMVHVLGDDEGNISNGVETFQAGYLLGFERSLAEQVFQIIRGEVKKGDTVTLTVDSGLSVEAVRAFGALPNTRGKNGAVVVMNYQTGELLCLVSLPNFDPHQITDAVRNDSARPFWNRALQNVYVPGSAFKVVTALGALRGISGIQTKVFECDGALEVGGTVITDANNAVHGSLSMARAFTQSCNNIFARIALEIGDETLRRAAEGFGFNDNFLFRDLVVENSVYPTTNRTPFEVAWSGAGQSRIGATPLHMCMIASGVANNGVMMEPLLVKKAESDNGVTRYQLTEREYRRCMTGDEANTLKGYMRDVVRNGTGRGAAIEGLAVCGKTGSAESSLQGQPVTHGWFIGFINDSRYPYAISVVVEAIEEGDFGSSTAVPIAKSVLSYLIKAVP